MYIPRTIVIPLLDFLYHHIPSHMTVFNQAVGEWRDLGLLPSSYYSDRGTKIKVLGITFHI